MNSKNSKQAKNFLLMNRRAQSKDEDDLNDYKTLGITGTKITPMRHNDIKSSAEIVSEARSMLNVGAARLVSTRRPVTPRDPRRQLYGNKLATPGRPPSSFSLRYLQFESGRPLPPLEPIRQQMSISSDQNEDISTSGSAQFRRSESVGALSDKTDHFSVYSDGTNQKGTPLLAPLNISTDNLQMDGSAGKTSNELEVPGQAPAMHLRPQWERQSRSFDLPLKASERLGILDVNKNESFDEMRPKNLLSNSFEEESDEQMDSTDADNFFQQKTRCKSVDGTAEFTKARILLRSNLLSQSTTDTLLEMLKAYSGIKECTDETVQHINAILVELYTRVKKGTKGNSRGAILGSLYGLVECSSSKILLAVARVVLALSVTGSNLTGACKLVFKVARNEQNDYLFFETDVAELLIDGLGRASPLEDPEACIYGYGAVRFLFNASTNQQSTATGIRSDGNSATVTQSDKRTKNCLALRLSKAGAIQLMVLHLQILNGVGAEKSLEGQPLHVLYQLSAALRALAGIPQLILDSSVNDNSKDVEMTDQRAEGHNIATNELKEIKNLNLKLACPHLVKAAEISIGESEIQTNIVRTLSVLSDHEVCCNVLAENAERIGILLGPCYSNELAPDKSLGLLSRLGYILGNIMAGFDEARVQFYQNDVAMEYLLNTLDIYSKQNLLTPNSSDDTVIEVLIKLMRVIANMSVNADVGNGIGTKPMLGQILLRMLMKINQMMTEDQSELKDEIEELLQAILGAMHNLCFYQEQTSQEKEVSIEPGFELTSMNELIPELAIALCNTLKTGSNQIKAEVSRVLGNMTRNPIARDAFCSAGGLKIIIKCLSSDDYELKSTCSGVLVNLLGDWERRMPFYEMCGPLVLNKILENSAQQSDWLLAGIVCQAFWNYLIDSCNVVNALGETETDKISVLLLEFLDEEKLFDGNSPDQLWEQFAGVATDLLERIQSSLETNKDEMPFDTDFDLHSEQIDVGDN